MVDCTIGPNSSLLCNGIFTNPFVMTLYYGRYMSTVFMVDGLRIVAWSWTCFDHWNVHKGDVSRSLKCSCASELVFFALLLSPWEENALGSFWSKEDERENMKQT